MDGTDVILTLSLQMTPTIIVRGWAESIVAHVECRLWLNAREKQISKQASKQTNKHKQAKDENEKLLPTAGIQ